MNTIADSMDKKVLKRAETAFGVRITHYIGKSANFEYVFLAEIDGKVNKYSLKHNRLTKLEK